MQRLASLVVALAIMIHPAAGRADDPPPVFSKMTFEEAKAASAKDSKLLVVKATASWCPPCQRMNKETWRDPDVEKWFGQYGRAIEFDVDKESTLATELRIEAMPTMIAFKDGQEFDRVVGYRGADDLIAWLDGVKRGEKSGDRLADQARRLQADGGGVGMQERLQAARGLMEAGKLDIATEEFAWLWQNIAKVQPSMIGVRGSFMASDMQRLAKRHAPARERFTKFRDDAEARLKGERKEWDDLDDWIVLNDIVGDQERTLAWFDRIKGQEGTEQTFEREAFRIERLLEERGRWGDMASLCRDPLTKVRKEHAQIAMMQWGMDQIPEEQRAHLEQFANDNFRDSVAKLYAGLLAGGREDDAAAAAAEVFRLDDTPEARVALVEIALKAGQAREVQLAWLDEAAKAGGGDSELRTQVEASLQLPPSLTDEAIAAMDRESAMKAWSARKKTLATDRTLSPTLRGRLQGEVEKLKQRMDQTKSR